MTRSSMPPGSYRIGIAAGRAPGDVRGQRRRSPNASSTPRSPSASRASSTVSTVNVFGNTHGRIVDETYRRDPRDGFLSYYDETKYHAHVAARTRIAAGAPIVIVMPGVTYGAGDHTALGAQFEAVVRRDGAVHRRRRPRDLADLRRRRGGRHRRGDGAGPDRRVVCPGRREHDRSRRHDRDRARLPAAGRHA